MPQTFMNESGKAVLGLLTAYRLEPGQVLVIFDDADLPLGQLRFRQAGGSGGHRGVASIIESIGAEFCRLRIGIGRPESTPEKGLTSFVLGPFTKEEAAQMNEALVTGVEGVETFITQGIAPAMEKFNRRNQKI
jgi:PTH1 family peptidyl-tRNA hydrolase